MLLEGGEVAAIQVNGVHIVAAVVTKTAALLDNSTIVVCIGIVDSVVAAGFEAIYSTRSGNVSGSSGKPTPLDPETIAFGRYLKGKIGGPPSDMASPHAHHILFKKGDGPAQQALVEQGQAILREVGTDPILGVENLVWAPNI
jgi:hypothetical protein